MRYIEFLDIDTPYSGALGKIEFDPFLAAVASLKTTDGQPLVSHWIDPKPSLSVSGNGNLFIRDASTSGIYADSGSEQLGQTNAINNQPTFTTTNGSVNMVRQNTNQDVNANEWSMLSVHNISEPTTSGPRDVFGIGTGSLGAEFTYPGLRINVTAGNTQQIQIPEGGTTAVRLTASIPDVVGVPVVTCSTFSTELGLSVFKNNFQNLVRNEADKRPLTVPTFTFLANRSAGNPAVGDFGMSFVLRADISKPEYAWARQILLGGLMHKYGIAPQ